MARLGELLTSARLIESGQVERALRAQVMWGARLGTNLVELGAIDLETLTRALEQLLLRGRHRTLSRERAR